jgi:hypothetical protein
MAHLRGKAVDTTIFFFKESQGYSRCQWKWRRLFSDESLSENMYRLSAFRLRSARRLAKAKT